MASRKQVTGTKISLDKAQARFNRVNVAYQADPDDTRKINAYRKAKTELVEARGAWRNIRDTAPDTLDDAVAEITTIGTTTTIT